MSPVEGGLSGFHRVVLVFPFRRGNAVCLHPLIERLKFRDRRFQHVPSGLTIGTQFGKCRDRRDDITGSSSPPLSPTRHEIPLSQQTQEVRFREASGAARATQREWALFVNVLTRAAEFGRHGLQVLH